MKCLPYKPSIPKGRSQLRSFQSLADWFCRVIWAEGLIIPDAANVGTPNVTKGFDCYPAPSSTTNARRCALQDRLHLAWAHALKPCNGQPVFSCSVQQHTPTKIYLRSLTQYPNAEIWNRMVYPVYPDDTLPAQNYTEKWFGVPTSSESRSFVQNWQAITWWITLCFWWTA